MQIEIQSADQALTVRTALEDVLNSYSLSATEQRHLRGVIKQLTALLVAEGLVL